RCRATGEQAEPTPSVIHSWNVVSPSPSPRGRPSARGSPMGRRGKDEGRSEGRSVNERIGGGPPRGGAPTRKRAAFPPGAPHETVRPTGSGGRADDSSLLLVRPPADPARQPRTNIVQVGHWPHRVPRGALGEA